MSRRSMAYRELGDQGSNKSREFGGGGHSEGVVELPESVGSSGGRQEEKGEARGPERV